MSGERVEDLAALGEVDLEGVDVWVVERDEIEVEDLVTLGEEVWDDVTPGLAGSAGEYDTFGHCGGVQECVDEEMRWGKEMIEMCEEIDTVFVRYFAAFSGRILPGKVP